MDAGLKRALEAKVYAGERLSREDGVALYESDDLAWLGRLAHHKRTELNGDRVMFSVNRHLDLANVSPGGRPVDEVVARAGEIRDDQLTEVHIVNAVHSGLPWPYYPEMLRALVAALPGVGLRGFGADEIRRLEEISGRPAEELLDELAAAGLESLTGGGAESVGWDDWARVHRLAHRRGMKTPASVLYGHGEDTRHRVDHVIRLRELQDETDGFAVFIPSRHQPDSADGVPAPPAESLKTFAVSRLLFDNVPHVKCSWATHVLSVAQLSLNFGADEIDGSAAERPAPRDVDAAGPMHRGDLLNLIWDAGFRPVERTTAYAVAREYDPAPSLADRRSEPQQVWA